MLIANFVIGTTVPANTNIPITLVKRTNTRSRINSVDNTIEFISKGLYIVDSILVAEATAIGDITAQIYRDGQPVLGAIARGSVEAVGDFVTLPLQDAFNVVLSEFGDIANVSVRCDVAITPEGGNIIAEYLS